jgi:uncharacterized protein YggU (UPF0235/DUF167 family)
VNLDRRSRPSDIRFAVRLTPRGGADRVEGVNDAGALAVRVAAAPVGGGANAALLRLLAEDLGVAKGAVRLVAGATGRHKLVAVEGLAPEDLLARWPGLKL